MAVMMEAIWRCHIGSINTGPRQLLIIAQSFFLVCNGIVNNCGEEGTEFSVYLYMYIIVIAYLVAVGEWYCV